MKLTSKLVRAFEADQKEHGTRTALYNLLWLHATAVLHAIGAAKVKTTLKRGAAILLAFLCVSCTTLPDGTRGPNLFAIRTSAALATDIALASLPRSERAEVQAYLPALASAVHSLAGGAAPTPAQVDAILASWTDRPLPVVRIAASAVGAIYATYYPSIRGNAAQALAVLGAIADGVALSGGFVATVDFKSGVALACFTQPPRPWVPEEDINEDEDCPLPEPRG